MTKYILDSGGIPVIFDLRPTDNILEQVPAHHGEAARVLLA